MSTVKKHECNEEINKFKQHDQGIKKKVFNMRLVNLKNLSVSSSHRNRPSFIRAKYGIEENPALSFDLLRQALQTSINIEIDKTIRYHIETFFEPAKNNIQQNCGLPEHVLQDFVASVCCQMLEEAKKMYSRNLNNNQHNTRNNNTNSKNSNNNIATDNISTSRRKRTYSSGSESSLSFLSKRKHLASHLKTTSGRSTPNRTKVVKMPVKKEGPKWDSCRLTTATEFIMGSKANKALGLGSTRGRLYIKHPELFKYGGDQDDKQWLYENDLMPATGGRTYLLILDDILQLTLLGDYRDSAGLDMKGMVGFRVPIWMVEKMRTLMDSQHTNKLERNTNGSGGRDSNGGFNNNGNNNENNSRNKNNSSIDNNVYRGDSDIINQGFKTEYSIHHNDKGDETIEMKDCLNYNWNNIIFQNSKNNVKNEISVFNAKVKTEEIVETL